MSLLLYKKSKKKIKNLSQKFESEIAISPYFSNVFLLVVGLKILSSKGRVGSTPTTSTRFKIIEFVKHRRCLCFFYEINI